MNRYFFLLVLALFSFTHSIADERPYFALVVPAYNNEMWIYRNIRRAINQDYDRFHIYYIDDASTDNSLDKARKIIAEEFASELVTFISNKERVGALENIYSTIHNYISDDEIVVLVNGDDWLAGKDVLSYLSKVYEDQNVWLTYGQYRRTTGIKKDPCTSFLQESINEGAFRKIENISTHLRTFKAWLFKNIEESDLKREGEFFQMSWDLAIMLPMFEMAKDHFRFINKTLYVLNEHNPLSDFRIDPDHQREIAAYVRRLPPYKAL